MSIPDAAEIYGLDSEAYGNIRESYIFLWNLLVGIGGLEIKGSDDDLDISHPLDDTVTVKSDSVFKIKGVGFEAGQSAGPIDICFKPDLTITGVEFDGRRCPVIESSATAVTYLKVDERDRTDAEYQSESNRQPAKVLSAFHYDFEMDTKERHPIFHTQYEPSSIELGILAEDYDITNQSQVTNSVPNHPRIPTAPLDFTGVLCMLIHEHKEEFDSAWPNGTLNAVKRLPTFPPWCFRPNPVCDGALVPEWWYFAARNQTQFPEEVVEGRGI